MGHRKTKKPNKIQLSPTLSDNPRPSIAYGTCIASVREHQAPDEKHLTEPPGLQPERNSRSGVVGEEAESSPYSRLGVVTGLLPFFLCDPTHLTNEDPIVDPTTKIATGSAYLALIYQSSASSLSSSVPPLSQLRDDDASG
ncbi:hypothetical protein U1Q18_022928 [Sarracenia purpurea var. burkii]